MKGLNRILSVLLCFILIGSAAVLNSQAFNGNISTDTRDTAADDDVSISFIEVEGKTASVDLINEEACKLVVAVFDPESGKMLASGIKDIEKNAGNVKVGIDIPEMPEYFLLRAFALDSDMSALCGKYESPLYTKKFTGYRMVSFFVNEINNGISAAIPGAVITASDGLCDNDGDSKWDDNTATADENGIAVMYFKQGNHSVSVSADGYFESASSFDVTDNGDTVQVSLIRKGSDGSETPSSDGTGCADGWVDYRHFNLGSYPQTDVTDTMGSVLNSEHLNWKSYRYYCGTGNSADGQMKPGDYMLYCDVSYGEEKYRGVTFSSYRPNTTGYKASSDTKYSHQFENGYNIGNIYWFKYEPLKWRVINSQAGLVISDIIIDSVPYSDYIKKGSDGEYYNDKGAYSYDWDTSTLKAWLNDDFYRTAFTADEQSRINEDENGSLFILTEREATNPVYFTSAFPRQADGSDYAKCQGLSSGSAGAPEWRLRSPGYNSFFTCAVFNDGSLGEQCCAGLTGAGVRPSFYIDLSSLGARPNSSPRQALTARSFINQNESQDIQSSVGTGIFDYSCTDCEAGCNYILVIVTGFGGRFNLTSDNLEYIDQVTADADGSVSGKFIPRNTYSDSTTLLIGKFGSTVSQKLLSVTEEMVENPESELPDINIRNYKNSITVDYKAKLVFHTDAEAPEGYWIVWSTGDVGSSCTVDKAVDVEYKIKADLIRASDNKIIKSTQEETVKVKTGIFAKIIAFFREIFNSLPLYEDNVRK